MILKSLKYPMYERNSKGGLSGKGELLPNIVSANFSKTFDEAILDLFEGEVVMENSRFSPELSEMTKRNIQKIK
jgi:hypothetical protein